MYLKVERFLTNNIQGNRYQSFNDGSFRYRNTDHGRYYYDGHGRGYYRCDHKLPVCKVTFIKNLSNPRGTRLSGGRPYQSRFDYEEGTREDTFLEFVSQYVPTEFIFPFTQ